MRLFALAAALLIAGSAAAQTLTIQVSQETSANSGTYAPVGTIQGYSTTGTVASFYNYNGASGNRTYAGTTLLPSALVPNGMNTVFVVGSDGLGFITIHGPRAGATGGGNTRTMVSVHNVVGGGAFVAPLAVTDDADDTFTFAASNTQLTASTSSTSNRTDGFAARFSGTTAPVVESQFVSSNFATPPWRVHNASGTALSLAAVPSRRVRFELSYALAPGAVPSPQDVAGWRLLSSPFGGLDVLDLAEVNLVLGVPAGATNAAQYPNAGGSNLYHEYRGAQTVRNASNTADSTAYLYTPVPNTDYTVEAGKGLWWYWYDRDLNLGTSRGGGIGVSYDLANPEFSLSVSGAARLGNVSATFPLASVPTHIPGAGYFYMGGNPFAAPFNVNGISATNGTVQSLAYAWDPTANAGAGNHVPLARSGAGTFAAVWQGLMIEVTPSGTAGPTVSYSYASTNSAQSPTFYGKGEAASGRPAPEAEQEFHFTLSGTGTEDQTWLRFAADAEEGWDAQDATKYSLSPAQVAFAGERGKRLGMTALPDGRRSPLAREVALPLSFVAAAGGSYTLAWDGSLANGWKASLLDRVTGERTDMRRAEAYTFTSDATDWTDRFEVIVRPVPGAATTRKNGDVAAVSIGEAYPNPASGASRLEVVLDESRDVRVAIYDALGREVAVAHDGALASGANVVTLPVASLANGTYVVRVTGGDLAETRRLTVVR